MDYLLNFENFFEDKRIFFFTIIILIYLFISILIKKKLNIDIYSIPSLLAIYCFINFPFTTYQLIIGSILATLISFFIYKVSEKIFKNLNMPIINILNVLITLPLLLFFNCFSMPSLSYTLLSFITIKNSEFNYLTSYIMSCIIIFIICYLVLEIIKIVDKDIFKSNIFYLHFTQLEKNITNQKS